mmetsp:Transcript_8563/g.7906  ORF Transcript_8563/g.7906 Transcript_8563/m.7906 type:complete len:124 (-) Transcript_8563:520-891(-)
MLLPKILETALRWNVEFIVDLLIYLLDRLTGQDYFANLIVVFAPVALRRKLPHVQVSIALPFFLVGFHQLEEAALELFHGIESILRSRVVALRSFEVTVCMFEAGLHFQLLIFDAPLMREPLG